MPWHVEAINKLVLYTIVNLILINRGIGQMSKVFANGPGDRSSIQSQVIPKTKKWYLMLPCLTLRIIRYGSRENGAIQRMEQHPYLHPGVVAIEKGVFGSPSNQFANITFRGLLWFLRWGFCGYPHKNDTRTR